jgi:glycosyltransferase involved in cell wall biosynthesis
MSSDGDKRKKTVSVIIPAYSAARWALLCRAVESAERQTHKPLEIIVCIDNNAGLLEMAEKRWAGPPSPYDVPIRVIASDEHHEETDIEAHVRAHGSRRRFGAGQARNCAARQSAGEILAFLDDDAAAFPDWLATLVPVYDDPLVQAVGGAPIPDYETERPRWIPTEFNWVFGCAYEGLPLKRAPTRHLIGANMSVRAGVLKRIGGFHSIDFDDMDMCHRVAAVGGRGSVIYEPLARVYHYVPAERVSWQYFWRRCFYVNRHKVAAFKAMGQDANLKAEVRFVTVSLTRAVARETVRAAQGDVAALQRLATVVAGVSLACAGHAVGQYDLLRYRGRRGSRALVDQSA